MGNTLIKKGVVKAGGWYNNMYQMDKNVYIHSFVWDTSRPLSFSITILGLIEFIQEIYILYILMTKKVKEHIGFHYFMIEIQLLTLILFELNKFVKIN